MTLPSDVGQLLWIGFPSTTVSDDLARRIAAGECGAVILFGRNLAARPDRTCDLDAVAALIAALHAAAPAEAPLLVAVDQEGGTVQRLRAPATVWPPMLRHDDAVGDAAGLAEAVGSALGRELAALGFDIDFAPVLDVHTNPANPVIGERAFGRDAGAVADRALAFARGLASAGVLACGKHFPGHGDTTTDSHLELPRVDHAWERLERIELLPFVRAAAAGLPMIMTAHVVFAALDAARPATLSPVVVGDLLRRRLGFGGVIVSDCLEMRAIADHVGVAEAAVAAVRAGCDAVLICHRQDRQQAAFAALVAEGERDAELGRRIADAAARVRAMKAAHAERRCTAGMPGREVIGAAEHRNLAERLARGRVDSGSTPDPTDPDRNAGR